MTRINLAGDLAGLDPLKLRLLLRMPRGDRRARLTQSLATINGDAEQEKRFWALRRVWRTAIERESSHPNAKPFRIAEYGARLPIGNRHLRLRRTLASLEQAPWTDVGSAHIELDGFELQALRKILESLLDDEDARGFIWQSLAHRPKDTRVPTALALFVVLGLRGGKKEKACKADLADISGATADQIKHALAEFRELTGMVVDSFDASQIEWLARWNRRSLDALKLKKPKNVATATG